jgi:hypothetical protein
MAFHAPLGESDFRQIRKLGAVYVDKTAAITEIALSATKVFLFTRPRRFGKSTLLSTLHAFFQRPDLIGEDTSPLFADLEVWRSERAQAHHQRYPVLWLSFKDVQQREWPLALESIRTHLSLVVNALEPMLQHPAISDSLRDRIQAMIIPGAGEALLQDAIMLLSKALQAVTGQPVVLLIDEYDSPLHAAWTHGYLDHALPFFRSLLGGALKENPALHKAVITGILRVARESLFSGVNHLSVHSVLSGGFASTFGFTQDEVVQLATSAGLQAHLPGIEAWYNGYLIGGVRLYNPWSILNYLARPQEGLRPWWVNTGGTVLIEALLDRFGPRLWPDVEALLNGGAVRAALDENLVLADLAHNRDALWSLLLAAGYLRPVHTELRRGRLHAELVIPNEELLTSWQLLAARHLEDALTGSAAVEHLVRAMFAGNERAFAADLRTLAANALSYHDTAGDWPERVWQAFVLGVLVHLSDGWEVRSNLELGYGRADVIVRPRKAGRPGVLMELKRVEAGESVEVALEAALQQISSREYALGLGDVADRVVEIAIVFEGKRPYVRMRRGVAPGQAVEPHEP